MATKAPSGHTFDPATMALRGRVGAYAAHACHSPDEQLAPARRGFLARFDHQARSEAEARGETDLSDAEIARRAEMLLKAHMARLALASHSARQARTKTRQEQQAS